MSLMISRGDAAQKKIFAADYLSYIEKSPLKALALRRPVVHKRLSDFVALWSYIQRATPRGEQKKICIFFFRAAQTGLSSGSSLRHDSGTTLTRLAPLALPTHFFSGPESWGVERSAPHPRETLRVRTRGRPLCFIFCCPIWYKETPR
jgi:hypothetical protein